MLAVQETLGVDSGELERQTLTMDEARLQVGIALAAATQAEFGADIGANT
jgi:hypothetical protein